MSRNLNDHGTLFTRTGEDGFDLPTNRGVRVHPLLAQDAGTRVDVMFMTIEPGARVARETHPYTETLVVIDGELTCAVEDGEPVVVRPGQVWHILADRWHEVRNTGDRRAETALLVGV